MASEVDQLSLAKMEAIRNWDSIALLVLQSPSIVGIFASFGYVGHLLLSGEELTKRRIVGGAMLSIFTATAGYFVCKAWFHMSVETSVPVAMLLGSLCETGYSLLTDKAKKLLGGDDDDNR